MQIVCPNCSTAYEIPDAAFGGRARKLRCENCGTQWRAGPPLVPTALIEGPAAPPEPVRVFGKPADAEARVEFDQAMERETLEHGHTAAPAPVAPPASAPPAPAPGAETPAPDVPEAKPDAPEAAPAAGEGEDPFINLVMAARNRSIEFEPEPPQPGRRLSSPVLIGILLVLFVGAVAFLLLRAR